MGRVAGISLLAALVVAALTAALASPAPERIAVDDLEIEVFLGDGNLVTETRSLNFQIVVEVASSSGVPHSITMRTALPAGLRFGSDAPGSTDGCTGTDPVVCTVNMQPNPAGTIGFNWRWDVVAERVGSYEITATVEAAEPDPDLSNNSDTFRFAVVASPPPPPPPSPPPAALVASAVTLSPGKPKAGSAVSATVRVTAGGAPVRPSGIACTAKIGSAKLRGAAKAASGTATCVYRPPRNAKGKILRGAISFTARGTKFSRRFSAKLG